MIHTYESVYNYIKNNGNTLLSTHYKNIHEKLSIQCDCGNIYQMSFHQFYHQNQRCLLHKGERISKSKAHSIDFIREQLKKNGYILISTEYKNGMDKIKVQCPNGHQYFVRWNNFQQGKRCPICSPKYSRQEKEIVSFIKSIYNGKIIENDRTQIINPITGKMLELDIYLPELNKAIEYNGKYWHLDEYTKYKDIQKIKQCKEKNINLLIINENDWLKDKPKTISNIYNFL